MEHLSTSTPEFTHFESTQHELPVEFYFALGHALYRWSQLEASMNAITTSTMDLPWLEAVSRLRGTGGNAAFKLKNNFQKIRAETEKKQSTQVILKVIDRAEKLYEKRKFLFHSLWGFVTGPNAKAVGIQEWSNTSYSNFRQITIQEIESFAHDCRETNLTALTAVIPHLHGAKSIIVDDSDGHPRPYSQIENMDGGESADEGDTKPDKPGN